MRLGLCLKVRILVIIHSNLDSTDSTFASVDVAIVAQRFVAFEDIGEFFKTFGRKFCTQLGILRHRRQLDAFHHALHIKPRPTAHNHRFAAICDIIIASLIVTQILKEVVLVTGLADVNHVVKHVAILIEVFSSSQVHATVKLARIGANDFAAYRAGKSYSLAGLARSSGTCDYKH